MKQHSFVMKIQMNMGLDGLHEIQLLSNAHHKPTTTPPYNSKTLTTAPSPPRTPVTTTGTAVDLPKKCSELLHNHNLTVTKSNMNTCDCGV